MTVTFEIPEEVENELRAQGVDMAAEAKEAMLVMLYRQEKLSRPQLGNALGLSRFEVDGLLKKHKVVEDLPTSAELAEDLENARRMLSL